MVSDDTAAVTEPLPGPSRPSGGERRVTLRRDIRAAGLDFGVSLLVTAAVFALLYARIRSGASDTVKVMPFMKDADTFWMYWLSQAFGWSALLWAYGTVVVGLLLAGPRPGRFARSHAAMERLHRTTSLSAIVLIFAHALMFAAELVRYETKLSWTTRFGKAFVDTFVPGGYSSGTGEIAIPIGQAALYTAIPLGLLFYWRHRIGARAWRALHRFVIVVYVLSVWHTLLYGTNVWYDGWPRTTLWALQLPVAALFLHRLLRPLRRGERPGKPTGTRQLVRWAVLLAAVATLVALCAVLLSGRDGGRARSSASAAGAHDQPLGVSVVGPRVETAEGLDL
ncbi:ferric reductase-like transmembrane domain-containing protein [Streptomyces sp. NPDC048172]|uniref:ferric reductase-like transmembrane domain-containing protein n=1 Tax=Streptomyces sp. NPDC048172 TaxID=3365505 RepID=UPI003723D19C